MARRRNKGLRADPNDPRVAMRGPIGNAENAPIHTTQGEGGPNAVNSPQHGGGATTHHDVAQQQEINQQTAGTPAGFDPPAPSSPSAPAGPTVQESRTYRRAARAQARLIQKYALDNERSRLEDKHYDFDNQGRIKKVKATRQEIRTDLRQARQNVKKTTARLFSSPRVYRANIKGKVVRRSTIERIDSKRLAQQAEYRAERRAADYQHESHEVASARTPERVPPAARGQGQTYLPSLNAEKDYDLYVDPDTGKTARFSDSAPLGWRVAQALTGADAGASATDPKHIAEVVANAAAIVGSAGLGAALRGPAAIRAGEAVVAAERAAAIPEFASRARGARAVGTGADLTGDLAPSASKLERLLNAGKARYGPANRAARRAKRLENLTLKAVNPVVPAVSASQQGRALAQGHLQALSDDPDQVLKTTLRTVMGMPSATIAPFIDIAEGRGEEALDSFKDYADTYAELFSGDPERVEETITNDLGLVPAITAGLGGVALGRTLGLSPSGLSRASKVERLAELAETGKTSAIRRDAKRQLANVTEMREPFLQAHEGRKGSANRSAVTAEMETGQLGREAREGGKRPLGIGPRQSQPDAIGELNTKKITDTVTQGDAVRLLSEEGLRSTTRDVVGKLERMRDKLKPSTRKIDPDEVHTREVLDALIAHPEVLKEPKLARVLDREVAIGRGRSIERHTERTGKTQHTPDPLDQPARWQSLARSENIRQPHERTPAGYKGKLTETAGQDMAKSIRAEAKENMATARKLNREARVEEARAKGAAKELNARRVADNRRNVNRKASAKVRRLEARRKRYEAALARAKKPEVKERLRAKIAQLKKQIKETKASATIAASPKRLETVKRATEHKAKARRLRGEAKALQAQARANAAIVNRHRQADRLDIEAEAKRAQGKDREAVELNDRANKLRAAADADEQRLRSDFLKDVRAAQKREGYAEPAFQRHTDVTDRGGTSVAAQDFPGARSWKKERFREGVLAEQGRIDESALTLITNSRQIRAGMAERWRQRDFVISEFHKDRKGRRFFNDSERAGLEKAGKVPPGYEWVELNEFMQGLHRSDALRGEIATARKRAIATAPKGHRKLYGMAPRAALREHRAQESSPLGKVLRGVRAAARIQTIGMLATSTAWFAFQFPATFIVMAARNPNPMAWVRATKRYMDTYRGLSRQERINLNAHFAGNPADFLAVGENVRGLTPHTVEAMNKSAQIAFSTPAGKILNAVWDNVRKGGPLIAANRRYESFQRRFQGMLEMDRIAGTNRKGDLRISARPKEFIASTARLNHLVRRDLKQLKGKSYAEQSRFYLENPKRMKEIEKAVNDAYGNWASLTSAEKKLSSIVVFYPFVRFSLRWMFWSFPKNNPIKAAIYLNMAQKNAQELQEFLGGPPSFFSDWGKIITHTGEGGAAETKLNLGRAAPGGNAVVESLAGAKDFNLQTVLRPVQPIAGIASAALTGKDQYGEDLPDGVNPWANAAKSALGLNPLTRPLGQKIVPPSEWSELFNAIDRRDEGLAGSLIPDLMADPEADQEAARVGRMLEVATSAPSYADVKAETDKATKQTMLHEYLRAQEMWKKLDGYLVAYGIKTAEEIKQEDEDYSKQSEITDRMSDRATGEETKKKPTEGYGAIDLPDSKDGYGDLELPGEGGAGGYGDGGKSKSQKTSNKTPAPPTTRTVSSSPTRGKGKIIGTPYQGTHTRGNWQSDNAVDIAVPEGTPIRAAKAGTVDKVYISTDDPSSPTAGYQITIGGDTFYTHLQTANVKAGDHVEVGDVLGKSGSANGVAHLHFATAEGTDPNSLLTGTTEVAAAKTPQQKKVTKKLEAAAAKANANGVPEIVPEQYRASVLKWGSKPEFEAIAASHGITGPELMAKVVTGESGWNPEAESDAGAKSWTQFIDSTRDDFIERYGFNPASGNFDDAVHGTFLHMTDYQSTPGIAGYNPNMPDYTEYILSQDVGPTLSGKPVPKALRRQANRVLGPEETKKILEGDTGGAPTVAAPPRKEVLKWLKPTEPWSEVADELGTKRGQAEMTRMAPEMQTALVEAAKEVGQPIQVTEGWRSRERQEYLYGPGRSETTGVVAAPGTSPHEGGYAVDLANVTPELEAALAARGIHPLAGDPGHYDMDPSAQVSGTTATSSSGPSSYVPSVSSGGSASSGTAYTPAQAETTKTKGRKKPRFDEAALLKAIGKENGFNELFGIPGGQAPTETDATMAAMAEIAATRKRLLKR